MLMSSDTLLCERPRWQRIPVDIPRESNLAAFQESDQITDLDLPQDRRLPEIARSIEIAMKTERIPSVRSLCAEFLENASRFYQVQKCGVRVLAARPFRSASIGRPNSSEITIRFHADSDLDANCSPERNDVFRNFPQHTLPRILPSSRFPEVQIRGFMAYSRIFRKSRGPLSSRTRHSAEAPFMGSDVRRALANRLAWYES